MSDYCRYCKKTLNDLEVKYIALHHPDKQLCRPCFVYRQPESQLQKPPLTDQQKKAEAERVHKMIKRLLAVGMEQNT